MYRGELLIQRLWFAWGALGRTFGIWIRALCVGLLLLSGRLVISIGMVADHLFFRTIREARIRRPIVIVGNPRSGTTFLQRWLIQNDFGAGMQLWQLICPSFTLQKLVYRFVPFLENISPARFHSTVAHDTNLLSVETDDAAVLFRYFDGFFVYGFFLAHHELELLPWFDPQIRDTGSRDFRLLEAIWRRSMVWNNTEGIVAKLFSTSIRMPSFFEYFPDARIIYLIRDPIEVIPSAMSLVTGVQNSALGFWDLPESKQKLFLDRLYNSLVNLLRQFHADWTAGRISRSNVLIVTYPRLMSDFKAVLEEICAFTDHSISEVLRQSIDKTDKSQSAYQSKHQYDLKKFGLTAEKIRQDCSFVYETFLDVDGHSLPGDA